MPTKVLAERMQQQRDTVTELSQMMSQMHMLNVETTHHVCVYLVGYVIMQHVTSSFFFFLSTVNLPQCTNHTQGCY